MRVGRLCDLQLTGVFLKQPYVENKNNKRRNFVMTHKNWSDGK